MSNIGGPINFLTYSNGYIFFFCRGHGPPKGQCGSAPGCFATVSHRNTNKIFNDSVRDFAWLQNLKAYKKCSKNSFFCRRRLGFQKKKPYEALQGQVFLFLPPCLNRSSIDSPIPNRYTQTLGVPSPIRIIQTHKQITFQNKNVAGYSLNPVSSIDRDMFRALMNLDRLSFCRGGIKTYRLHFS